MQLIMLCNFEGLNLFPNKLCHQLTELVVFYHVEQ